MASSIAWAAACALTMALHPRLASAQADEPAPLIVEDLQCRGNHDTDCRFILDHLRLAPGDRVDEQEIELAKLRLATLPTLESIDIYLEKGSAKGKAHVIVQVVEGDPIVKHWLIGTSARDETISQVFAGSVSSQNLFGTGKTLDLTVWGRVPIEDPARRELSARLEFASPHLFDTPAYFVAGVGRTDALWQSPNGNRFETKFESADVLVGVRLWRFSYFSLGFQRRGDMTIDWRWRRPDATFETLDHIATNVPFFVYGWNSEDDAWFPTRGSRFQLVMMPRTREDTIATILGRWTWRVGEESLLSILLGRTPREEYASSLDEGQDLALEYARPLHFSGQGGIRQGRWYISPGITRHGNLANGERTRELGLRAGVRLQTRRFGIVDLYIIGSKLNHGNSDQ